MNTRQKQRRHRRRLAHQIRQAVRAYTRIELEAMTRADLMEILDDRGNTYLKKDTKASLVCQALRGQQHGD